MAAILGAVILQSRELFKVVIQAFSSYIGNWINDFGTYNNNAFDNLRIEG